MSTLRDKYLGKESSKTLRKKYEEELKKQSQIRENVNKLFSDNGVMANTGFFSTQRIGLPVQQQQETVQNGFKINQDSLITNIAKEKAYKDVLNSDEYKTKEQELINQSNKVGYAKYDYDKALADEGDVSWFDKTLGTFIGGGKGLFDYGYGLIKKENGDFAYLPNYSQLRKEKVLDSYETKLGRFLGQAGYTLGEIGTASLLNMVVPTTGTTAYFGKMFVDSTNDAMNQGYDSGSATIYGMTNTALEVLTGKLLGSATKGLTGGKSSAYEKLLENTFNKVMKKPKIASFLANAGSEATEEFIQEYLDNITKLAILDKSTNASDYASIFTNPDVLADAIYSAGIGAISGGLLGSVTGVENNTKNNEITRTFKEQLEETKNNTTDANTISQIDNLISALDGTLNATSSTTSEITEITNQLEEFHNLQNQNRLTKAQEQQMIELQEKLNELQEAVNQEPTNNNSPMTVNEIVEQENSGVSSNTNMFETNANSLNNDLTTVNDLVKNNTNIPIKELSFEESARKYDIDPDNDAIKGINLLLKQRGIKGRFDSTIFPNKETNAVWIPTPNVDGTISREVVFNPNADTESTLQEVAIHEMFHDIYSGGSGDILKQMIDSFNYNIGAFVAARNSLVETYKRAHPNVDYNSREFQDIIDEEVIASILGRKLGSQEYINRLVHEQPSFAKMIYDFVVEKLNQLNRLIGYKNEKLFWADIKNKFDKAYREEYKKSNSAEPKFSIQTDENGNKYIEIDTDQNIFDGIESKDYNKIAKMYINDYLRGETVLSENDKATIDSKSARKYTNPGKKAPNFKEKMKLTPELKNVLRIAQKDSTALPSKEKSQYSKWEYYKFKFKLDEKSFKGTVNIGIDSSGGKHFYEVNNIKRTSGISETSPNRPTGSSISNIPQFNNNVKSDISNRYSIQGSQNNTSEIQGMNVTKSQVEDAVYEKFDEMLSEYGFDVDEIMGVYLHGSRLRRTANPNSDLDAVVFYIGNESEDYIFNTINDDNNQLIIDGVKVDINPVSIDSLSEMDDYIKKSEEYDKEVINKPQVDNQGRNLSKKQQAYFKNSKARDENGNLVTVYHTTTNEGKQFNEFNPVGTDHYRFGNQVVNYYTDDKEMSGSYANQSYIMADTKKITSMEQVNDYIKTMNILGWGGYRNYKLIQDSGKYKLIDNTEVPNLNKTWQQIYDEANEYKKQLTPEELVQFKDMFNNEVRQGRIYDIDAYLKSKGYEFGSKQDEIARKYLDIDSKNVTESGIYFDVLMRDAKYHAVATFDSKEELFKKIRELGSSSQKRQYEGYVNITNPYIIDAEGKNWSSVERSVNERATEDINKLSDEQKRELEKTLTEIYDKNNKISKEFQETQRLLDNLRDIGYNDKALIMDYLVELEANDKKADIITLKLIQKLYNIKGKQKPTKAQIMERVNNEKFTPREKSIIDEIGYTFIANPKEINTIRDLYDALDYGRKYRDFYNRKGTYAEFQEAAEEILPDGFFDDSWINPSDLYQLAENGFNEQNIDRIFATEKSTNDIVKRVIELNKNGFNYDGIIMKNVVDYGGKTNQQKPNDLYVTFNSNQFKAVDNTNPTKDKDIRYSQEDISWEEYLDKYYPREGTGTKLKDIKLPIKGEENKINLPLKDNKSQKTGAMPISKQIENQGIKILVDAEKKRQGMIKNFSDYLDEKDITLPTQKDIDDSLVDILGYDNEQTESDKQKEEKLYNQYVREYMKENKIPFKDDNTQKNDNTNIQIDKDIEELASILQERPTLDSEKDSRLLKLFNIKFLDKGYYVDKLARKQKNRELSSKYDYMLSANGIAQQIIGNERFNPKTQKNEGKGLYKIFEPIENSGKLSEFSDYIYHKHNIDRMNLSTLYQEDNKPIFGDSVTSEKSKEIVDKYERENPEFVEWAKDVYDYNNFLLDILVDYGVIDKSSKEYYNKKYPYYVPTIRATDKTKVQMDFLGKNASINSPIKKAKGGNQDIIPLKEAMSLRTMQTINSALRNNFGNELLNTIETEAEKSAIPLDDVIGDEMDADDLLTKSTNKKSATFTVFKDGQKVTFGIPDEIYEALAPSTRVRINALNKFSQLRRALTTNYNPAFALTNPIKDVQDGILNSKHPALFSKNVAEAAMQIKKKGDLYKLYLANGGSYETYFNYGKGYNKIPQQRGKFSPMKIVDKINSINESIEMTPRLAEFIASLEAGDSIETAMYNAQEITTNFKRGGDITKNLDANGATFLNAGVQGTLKQIRNIQDAKTQGIRGMTSLAVKWSLVGLSAAVLNDMVWGDDDDYEDLSDYVKNNYYILWKYGDGKYVRIPKGRVMSVIQNGFQQLINKSRGEKVKINEFIDLLQNQVLPNDPTESNIFSPFVDVAKNKTWYGGDLVPQRLQQLPEEEQYDEGTDSISIWLGEKLKISPKKINYILDQYSGAIGDMILPALTLKAENESNSFLSTVLSPLSNKFTTDSVINNQNISDLYDLDDELTKKAKSSNATDEDILKSKYINSIQTKMNNLTAEKRTVQNDTTLTNNEKYEQVKEIQKRINSLAKEGLDNYKDVSVQNNYGSIADNEYYRNSSGEWQKLDTSTANYRLSKQIGSYNDYLTYKNEIDNIKDSYTNTNARKNAVINYVNSLDLSIPQKAMLIKMNYSSFRSYDNEIINYIVDQNGLTDYEKAEMLEKLGFKIRNGRVYTK